MIALQVIHQVRFEPLTKTNVNNIVHSFEMRYSQQAKRQNCATITRLICSKQLDFNGVKNCYLRFRLDSTQTRIFVIMCSLKLIDCIVPYPSAKLN